MSRKQSIVNLLLAGCLVVGCTTVKDSIVIVGPAHLPEAIKIPDCSAVDIPNLKPIPGSPVNKVVHGMSRDKIDALLLDYIEQLKHHDQEMRAQIAETRDRQVAACNKSLR